jgi:hypothetical protein
LKLAAVTASRSEHSPSFATTSACVVTAMSVALARRREGEGEHGDDGSRESRTGRRIRARAV